MTNIKKLREKSGLSQIELSKLLNVGQSAVSMWENGTNVPKTEMLPKLAKIFGCTIDELFK